MAEIPVGSDAEKKQMMKDLLGKCDVEVPATPRVFGVSLENLQYSYDIRSKCKIPTVLLLLEKIFRDQGGLKKDGVFRETPGKVGSKEDIRFQDELNKGLIPGVTLDNLSLAETIKTWFRELPKGDHLLDGFDREKFMEYWKLVKNPVKVVEPAVLSRLEADEKCMVDALVDGLKPTHGNILKWMVLFMADLVTENPLWGPYGLSLSFADSMRSDPDELEKLVEISRTTNPDVLKDPTMAKCEFVRIRIEVIGRILQTLLEKELQEKQHRELADPCEEGA